MRSMVVFPESLRVAMASGAWRDPGPEALRAIVGGEATDLELFRSEAVMEAVSEQVASATSAGLWYAFVQTRRDTCGENDGRLPLDEVVFIAGSRIAGDDEFVVVQCLDNKWVVQVLSYDPNSHARWRPWGALDEFIDKLQEPSPVGG